MDFLTYILYSFKIIAYSFEVALIELKYTYIFILFVL